jgi:DNA primase catalytic core
MGDPMTTPRDRLVAAHDAAAAYYRGELLTESAAGPRDYLRRRGFAALIDSEVWATGYAPPGWTALTGHLRDEGFTDQELLDAGLVISTRRGTVVDRFRDRIIFGLRDDAGAIVGFTGRSAPGASTDCPKYLNSPSTSIYRKSHVLFGLAEQADRLAAGALPVITEGPLDALAVHSADNEFAAVSPCGTAITDGQVSLLSASTTATRVLVAFDADTAGTSAAARSHRLFNRSFADVHAIALAAGADPALVLERRGRPELRRALAATRPLADVLIDAAVERYADRLDSAEARICALRTAARLVAELPTRDIARVAATLAARLDLEHGTVTRELTAAAVPHPGGTSPPAPHRATHAPQRRPGGSRQKLT